MGRKILQPMRQVGEQEILHHAIKPFGLLHQGKPARRQQRQHHRGQEKVHHRHRRAPGNARPAREHRREGVHQISQHQRQHQRADEIAKGNQQSRQGCKHTHPHHDFGGRAPRRRSGCGRRLRGRGRSSRRRLRCRGRLGGGGVRRAHGIQRRRTGRRFRLTRQFRRRKTGVFCHQWGSGAGNGSETCPGKGSASIRLA